MPSRLCKCGNIARQGYRNCEECNERVVAFVLDPAGYKSKTAFMNPRRGILTSQQAIVRGMFWRKSLTVGQIAEQTAPMSWRTNLIVMRRFERAIERRLERARARLKKAGIDVPDARKYVMGRTRARFNERRIASLPKPQADR